MTEPDAARQALVHQLVSAPAASRLGIAVGSLSPSEVRLTLPADTGNCTYGDVVHGGVIATLADTAGVAVSIANARQLPTGGATTTLSISYLRPAAMGTLTARARLLHGGGRHNVARVTVTDPSEQSVAECHVTVTLS